MDNTIYVAVGDDTDDGYKTLEWTLKRWNSRPISIIILYVSYNISKLDLVHTLFGKLPASSLSEEKLQVIRKFEEGKTEKLLSTYIALCGKVKARAEILKAEKNEEQSTQRLIIESITKFRITKLVMGLTFMKNSSSKLKNAISGSFYVYQYKPEFCELFIICGGKQVFIKGNNEDGCLEDEQGITIAKLKDNPILKSFARMFSDGTSRRKFSHGHRSSVSTRSSIDLPESQIEWETNVNEIENYLKDLLALNLDEEKLEELDEIPETEQEVTEDAAESNMKDAEKQEYLRGKISKVQEMIQMKKKEAMENSERQSKAQWAICLCTARTVDLESRMKEESSKRSEIQKSLDSEKEQLYELIRDVEESKKRLSSLCELRSELSSKLQASDLAKVLAEARLEKAVRTRIEMIGEIEELRRQRDVFQRRIEFCREKDAIGMVSRMNQLSVGYREYAAEDVRLATDGFCERLRLKSGGDWSEVYRGRINRSTVAIKEFGSSHGFSDEDFHDLVNFLSELRHPRVVAMMGFCLELKCIVFEYMHNRSLRDILSSNARKPSRRLRWHDRIRIAYEVGSGLSFLHSAKPRPIVHGRLTPARILLDRNFVAKITGFSLTQNHGVRSDIRAFGFLLMQLLTARNWSGIVEDAMTMDQAALVRVLDETAGKWPSELAEGLAKTAMKCLSVDREDNSELQMSGVMEELEELRKKADDAMAREGSLEAAVDESENREDSGEAPNYFLCPIFKEVMKDPHIAADGFSYEHEAIQEWFKVGNDTSPMTNLRLKHKTLIPNYSLRSLIEEWQHKRLASGCQSPISLVRQ